MDRKSRRKPPSRRKRIQLDDLEGKKSPEKATASSTSAGTIFKSLKFSERFKVKCLMYNVIRYKII